MSSEVNQSARWGINSAISACTQGLVDHAQRCTEQGKGCNPSYDLNQRSRSLRGFPNRLDVFASYPAMNILRRAKTQVNTITDRPPTQEIAHNPEIWDRTHNVLDLRYSLCVANVVLRQC